MADFRTIYTRIWTDAWFSELEPDAKLMFIYLFSNPNASICGMYEMPRRNISIDTGIALERVDELLAYFAAAGKVYFENGIIWVVNLKKYNDAGDGVKVAVRIAKDISAISDCRIKRMYFEYHGIPYPESKIPYLEKKIPYQKNDSETETETDTDTDTETGKTLAANEFAERAEPVGEIPVAEKTNGGRSRKDPRTDLPAIQMIKRVTGSLPAKGAYDLLIRVLGENPDEEKFRLVYESWCARGYKPMNFDGMLEWYRKGIPEKILHPAGPGGKPSTLEKSMAAVRRAAANAEDRKSIFDGPGVIDTRGGINTQREGTRGD